MSEPAAPAKPRDRGDGRGYVDLAALYYVGRGVPASHERSLAYLRRARLMRSPSCRPGYAAVSLSPAEYAAYLDDLRRRPAAPVAAAAP